MHVVRGRARGAGARLGSATCMRVMHASNSNECTYVMYVTKLTIYIAIYMLGPVCILDQYIYWSSMHTGPNIYIRTSF